MEDEEENDKRNGDDHYGGHHGWNILTAESVLANLGNTIADEEILRIIRDQSWPYIRVPALDHLQDDDGHDGRRTDRYHDTEEILQVGGAVHLGGLIEVIRDLFEVFLQKVDIEDGSDRRKDQSGEGVTKSHVRNGDEVGDDHELRRNHHEGQEEGEHQVLPTELKP